jgi:hypothetical protein
VTPEPNPSPTQLIIPSPGAVTWDVVAQWVAIGILIACTVAVIFFVFNYLPKVKKIKPFYASIAAVAVLGGVFAFLLPVAFNSGFGKDDDGRVLRQLILYTTGGLLGVITLGETHRKNNQEKEKNENDHIRQVHAERRTRYAKAIEQLADTKASIRLGGIYTLVSLVDEWLTDESIDDLEKRKEEGQTIINNLCAYIQSMPENRTKNALASNAIPQDESNIRQLLFDEIKTRTKYMKNYTDHKNKNNNEILENSWGGFNFNFANSPIFYPLDGMHFPNADFSHADFYPNASFEKSIWINAKIRNCTFHSDISFNGSKFHGPTVFSESTFNKTLSCFGTHFFDLLKAENLRICGVSDFSTAEFDSDALFIGSHFHTDMKGREEEEIDWIENDFTKFWNSQFKKTESNIERNIIADFRDTQFFGFTDFRGTRFETDALFRDSKFMQGSNFERVEFTSADFKNSRLHWSVNFQQSSFSQLAYFVYTAGNFKDDTFLWAEFIYSTDHQFDFIHTGYIPKDKNFKNEHKEYPLGSTAYILKGENKISSNPARAISQSHKMLGNMNTIFP